MQCSVVKTLPCRIDQYRASYTSAVQQSTVLCSAVLYSTERCIIRLRNMPGPSCRLKDLATKTLSHFNNPSTHYRVYWKIIILQSSFNPIQVALFPLWLSFNILLGTLKPYDIIRNFHPTIGYTANYCSTIILQYTPGHTGSHYNYISTQYMLHCILLHYNYPSTQYMLHYIIIPLHLSCKTLQVVTLQHYHITTNLQYTTGCTASLSNYKYPSSH